MVFAMVPIPRGPPSSPELPLPRALLARVGEGEGGRALQKLLHYVHDTAHLQPSGTDDMKKKRGENTNRKNAG